MSDDAPTETADIAEVSHHGDDLAYVKTLFVEYAEGLAFSLHFQGFDSELSNLPGGYVPPAGNIWLARVNGAIAGCIALRAHEDGAAEIKRLYVRPGFRGHRLGTRLTRTAVDFATGAGYRAVRLDTVADTMREAQALYRQLGFNQRPPYYSGAPVNLLFFEKTLTDA